MEKETRKRASRLDLDPGMQRTILLVGTLLHHWSLSLKKLLFTIGCLIAIFLLSACETPIQTPDLRDASQQPTQTISIPTAAQTETKISESTSTPKPTITPTGFPPEARLTVNCWPVQPELPENFSSSGLVMLWKWLPDRAPDTLLLNLNSGEQQQLNASGESLFFYGMSPHLNLAAFVTYDDRLMIADAKGQQLKVIPWDPGWLQVNGWLDDQRLIIALRDADPNVISMRKPGKLLVLNPFNGDRQILDSEFPDYASSDMTVLPYWESGVGISFDPTFSRAVYPQVIKDDAEWYTYALWDLENDRKIADFPEIMNAYIGYNHFSPPHWSSDGSFFVFVGVNLLTSNETGDYAQFDLFRVSRDGQVEQLTHLGNVAYFWEGGYSLSPDGRYLAFYLGPRLGAAYEQPRMAVLDMETLEVTDTCVKLADADPSTGLPAQPVWSPDSKQFMVTNWYYRPALGSEYFNRPKQVLLFDLENGFAAEFAAKAEVLAWMSESE